MLIAFHSHADTLQKENSVIIQRYTILVIINFTTCFIFLLSNLLVLASLTLMLYLMIHQIRQTCVLENEDFSNPLDDDDLFADHDTDKDIIGSSFVSLSKEEECIYTGEELNKINVKIRTLKAGSAIKISLSVSWCLVCQS
jgi:hypothetical protein